MLVRTVGECENTLHINEGGIDISYILITRAIKKRPSLNRKGGDVQALRRANMRGKKTLSHLSKE